MTSSRFLFFLAALCGMAACKPKQLEGGSELAREAELHKVKRITQEQLFAEAYMAGDSITAQAQRRLKRQVAALLETEGVAGAMKLCKAANYLGSDSLQQAYQASISRTSQKPRNPANAPTGTAAELLDAYHYSAEKNLPLEPNVQLLENSDLLYTKPIVINDQLCLRCHGTPLQDIGAADWAALQAAYPQDKATGYKLGDLRGMWVVTFPREGLAKGISARPRKKRSRPNA